MKFALSFVCLALVVSCVIGQTTLDEATLDNIENFLDDPQLSDQLLECLRDMGASSGTQCPQQLGRASELASQLTIAGDCPACTPEEAEAFIRFRTAILQRPAILGQYLEVLMPDLSGQVQQLLGQ